MNSTSFDAVLDAHSRLTPLQLRKFKEKYSTEEPSDILLARLLLWNLAYSRQDLEPESRELLAEFWAQAADHLDDDDAACLVGLANSRYACGVHHTGWLDLKTGSSLTKIPPVVESTAINVRNLVVVSRSK